MLRYQVVIINSFYPASRRPAGALNLILFSIGYDLNPRNVAEFLDF
jgi:hypothetical protein